MEYISQHCCNETMDDKMGLYRKCCFQIVKIMVNKVIFVVFWGNIAQIAPLHPPLALARTFYNVQVSCYCCIKTNRFELAFFLYIVLTWCDILLCNPWDTITCHRDICYYTMQSCSNDNLPKIWIFSTSSEDCLIWFNSFLFVLGEHCYTTDASITTFKSKLFNDLVALELLRCLSLCNTQARAVNLIHAVLCDVEGVTQARGC